MSEITLGSVVTSGDKTVITGQNSGFDTGALIESLVEVRSTAVVQLETDLEERAETIGAYQELQTLINNFQSTLDFLRKPTGVNNSSLDVFSYRTTTSISNDASDPAAYLSVVAEPGLPESSFDITVTDIAKAKIQTSDVINVADTNTSVTGVGGPFQSGTLEINNGESVTLDDGDTLVDIAIKINNISDDTGVTATVIKVNDGEYRLQFKATETGTDADFDVTAIAGNTGAGGTLEFLTFNDTQLADNAGITIDGVAIVSQTNRISDAINGLEITVQQETEVGQIITSNVEADTELMANAVSNFANAYNDLQIFVSRQTERDESGSFVDTATLGSDTTLRTITTTISNLLTTTVDGLSGDQPNSLFTLRDFSEPTATSAISFFDFLGNDDTPATGNLLEVDALELQRLLREDFESIASVFTQDFQTTNSDVALFSSPLNLPANDYSITVDTVGETASLSYTDKDGNPQTVALDYDPYAGGVTLSGPADTDVEDFVIIYASTDSGSADFSITKGVASTIYERLDDLADDESGIIQNAIDAALEQQTDTEEEIARETIRIEDYRLQLISTYSDLEVALSSSNTISQLLTSLFATDDDS